MDIFFIAAYAFYEGVQGVINRRFNWDSFYTRCAKLNMFYAKYLRKMIVQKDAIGSGMVSVVYENKDQVIKLKRFMIEQRFRTSLHKLYQTLAVIRWFYPLPTYELTEFLCSQLDFIQEVENHKKFHSLIKLPFVVTPEIIHYTDEKIVMTKLTGVDIETLTEDERIECAKRLVLLILKCIHEKFIHADLGKVIVDKYTIGVIDFGLMIPLTTEESAMLLDIMNSMAKEDFKAVSKYFGGSEDVEAFIAHMYKRAIHIDRAFTVSQLVDINRKVPMPILFSKLILALHSVEPLFCKLKITSKKFIDIVREIDYNNFYGEMVKSSDN